MSSQANFKKITKCRICGNPKLIKIGSLGKIAVSDFTKKPSKGFKMPLELVFCRKCTLLQLAHNFNRDLLYKEYWYKSGLNPVIVEDLKEIASYSKGFDSHIDIGGNDGTLLKFSKASIKVSVDPSNINPGEDVMWYKDYFEDSITFVNYEFITAIACLYDLPNPNKFIKKVKKSLAVNGIFISQFQPLNEMVELNDIGNICHEHLEYYSYKSLVYLFEQNGLEIFKIERNQMNGGSYRLFARHFKKGSIKVKEKEYGIKELKEFFKRIEENKADFLIQMCTAMSYHKVYGYGASTKANTILQYYNNLDLMKYQIPAIIDINPDKKGKFTIATQIPIIDYIPKDAEYLWVFPYGFLDYFKKKEKGYKGKWVTTIPSFKIL